MLLDLLLPSIAVSGKTGGVNSVRNQWLNITMTATGATNGKYILKKDFKDFSHAKRCTIQVHIKARLVYVTLHTQSRCLYCFKLILFCMKLTYLITLTVI